MQSAEKLGKLAQAELFISVPEPPAVVGLA